MHYLEDYLERKYTQVLKWYSLRIFENKITA